MAESPEVRPLSENDRRRCEELKTFYTDQEWESASPARIRDKEAWEEKLRRLGKWDIMGETKVDGGFFTVLHISLTYHTVCQQY